MGWSAEEIVLANLKLGEAFNAVMANLSYVETDIRRIVKMAIDMIPVDSEYHTVVEFAWDVDCNAARIATVIAAANKIELNEKWTAPIGDKPDTYMRDIKKLSIYEQSKHTCELARMLNH